ncbi:universal stress protein [Acidithiobacillus sulfurivorans]|uniref:Universal stress protein n=1 Tax=Acidithiobacillus sulfurivorans TaxID=1958756 RepID=A0ABS5ZUW7_9PROT|nr:universal stress protein [Acidithiobacillus sulfurivorans]MBU2758950.1 universal stress protein [Acidithiobacillus sulfurivorans]
MSAPVLLTAIDGSQNALLAAAVAARFSRLLGARLGLVTSLHVANDPLGFGGGLFSRDLTDRLLAEARLEAESNLRAVAERIEEHCDIGLPEYFLLEGDPEQEIPHLVQSLPETIMVVVGQRGFGTESKPRGLPHLLGGLGAKLSLALAVPVLLVPPDTNIDQLCSAVFCPDPSQGDR